MILPATSGRTVLVADVSGDPETINPDGKPNAEVLGALTGSLAAHVAMRHPGTQPRPESLVLVSATQTPDTAQIRVVLAWSPEPDVVHLVGGPLDGARVRLPRDLHEKLNDPPQFVHVQLPPTPVAFAATRAELNRAAMSAEYRRAGIDPHLDRWVYEHAPTLRKGTPA